MTTPTDIALSRFQQGFSCSQSVFSAFAPHFGISEEQALKLASPFGGGIARQGHVCGAVSGALMALSLKYGTTTPDGKDETYKVARELICRFEEKHGTVICRELIGCDLSTPEGMQAAREREVFRQVCPHLVKDAADIVARLLENPHIQ